MNYLYFVLISCYGFAAYIESRNSLEITDIDKSIDNLLFSCNILDCQVDPTLSQELQILLEFSSDLALYLLLLLVQNPKVSILGSFYI